MSNVRVLAAGCLALAAMTAMSQDSSKPFALMVGDPAPDLTVSKWVKGEPVTQFKPGQVYVVEFWATWCGPCKVSIPHLTGLQKQYADKVKLIGVSVWESKQADVEPFVQEMGDKMAYTIAMDQLPSESARGNEGAMAKGWMMAAGQRGIPTAFIVNGEGKVAWIGHPMGMDEPLAQVVSGKWNLQAAAEEQRKEMELEAISAELSRKFSEAAKAGKWDDVVAVCDEMIAKGMTEQGSMLKFDVMLTRKKDYSAAYKLGAQMADTTFSGNAMILNSIAWTIVNPEGQVETKDLNLALRAASKAVELLKSKDFATLDTLARVHFLRGDKAKAIETQKLAIEVAPDDSVKEELKKALAEYEK